MQRLGVEWGLIKSSVAGGIAEDMTVGVDGAMSYKGVVVGTLPEEAETKGGLPFDSAIT